MGKSWGKVFRPTGPQPCRLETTAGRARDQESFGGNAKTDFQDRGCWRGQRGQRQAGLTPGPKTCPRRSNIQRRRIAIGHRLTGVHRSTLLSVVAVLGTSVGLVVLTTGFREGGAKRPQGRIVFAAEIDHNGDIFLINADGSHRRNLTRSDAREQGPDWSPNGKSIAYVNASDGPGGALYRMAANGAHPQVLFRETANQIMGAPAWSPDGRRVAFTSARNASWKCGRTPSAVASLRSHATGSP
jgi:hypothetical protein